MEADKADRERGGRKAGGVAVLMLVLRRGRDVQAPRQVMTLYLHRLSKCLWFTLHDAAY